MFGMVQFYSQCEPNIVFKKYTEITTPFYEDELSGALLRNMLNYIYISLSTESSISKRARIPKYSLLTTDFDAKWKEGLVTVTHKDRKYCN